jgi:hypothetical protein
MRIPFYQGFTKELKMTEKTEWEVVDTPSPDTRQTKEHFLKAMLGPWWRWKIASAVIVAGLALVFFAALAGVIVLFVAVGAILSICIAKFRRWLRRDHGSAPL